MKSYLSRLIARAAPSLPQPRQDTATAALPSPRGQEPGLAESQDPFENSLLMPEPQVLAAGRPASPPAQSMPPASLPAPEVRSTPIAPSSPDEDTSMKPPAERRRSEATVAGDPEQTLQPDALQDQDLRPGIETPSVERPDETRTIELPLTSTDSRESEQAEALRMADRFMERILEGRVPGLESAPTVTLPSPEKPAGDMQEHVAPSLQPAAVPAPVVASPEPLLTIGRLRVDVIPAQPQQPPAPARIVIRRPATPEQSPSSAAPPSVMRFGLRQV
jgi:hypothetical protein